MAQPQSGRFSPADIQQPQAPAGSGAFRPDAVQQTPAQPTGGGVQGFMSEFVPRVNPLEILRALGNALTSPIETGRALLDAQGRPLTAAQQAYQRGDMVDATRSFINYLLPVIGPELQHQGDLLAQGKTAEGIGAMAGTGVGIAAPAALSGARLTPRITNPNPQAAQAVRAGMDAGVPVDAATATGNRAVGAIQHIIDRQPGGSLVAGRAQVAQERGLARRGEELANRAHPSPVTPELAGSGVRDAVTDRVKQFSSEADSAYERLRQLEQERARPVQIWNNKPGEPIGPPRTEQMVAVDLKLAKESLTPVYRDLMRQSQIAPGQMMGDKARALVALDRLMNAPDMAPLSVVDGALSDLKAFVRKADMPETRTAGQGAVAQIVQQLDNAVIGAAKRAGTDVVQALMEGRKATISKHRSVSVLDLLNDEPVRTFGRATQPQDAAIAQLREIAKEAPGELPKIGRAYLDDLLGQATAEGGFKNAGTIATKWERLGPETKRLLFRDAQYIRDLDDFFRLSRQMAASPNPSGTAPTALAFTGGAYAVMEPVTGIPMQIGTAGLSKLLHSRQGVKLLTEGLRLPSGRGARNVGWFGQLMRIAGEDLRAAEGR